MSGLSCVQTNLSALLLTICVGYRAACERIVVHTACYLGKAGDLPRL